MMYSPDSNHIEILKEKPSMAFNPQKDFETQKKQISEKFKELLGEMPEKVPLDPVIEYEKAEDGFTEYRINFAVEPNVRAVCLLCIPTIKKEKYPIVICVQGHAPGMQSSMGRTIYGFDPSKTNHDYALQAIKQGYAALCLEQRGMGERRSELQEGDTPLIDDGGPRCLVTSMAALLIGRTMIGERCWDISRAIDLALTFPQIDKDKIVCTGNSGGGTVTYYAACLDERIKVAMPSCGVCTYKDSIGAMPHCSCNYIPKIARYFDMGDLAVMIAPRKLILINGKKDLIFPEKGVKETFDTIKKIYTAIGAPDNCIMTTGEGGHRYYKKEAWDAFDRITLQDF